MGSCGSSPTAGSSSATCLRKFSVHFRRNERTYKGQFGFDYLSDDYKFDTKYEINSNGKVVGKNGPLYLNRINDLQKEYNSPKGQMYTHSNTYFPSWLSIFAIPKNGERNTSTINQKGADLLIEIEQMYFDAKEPLTNDGTVIEFIPTTNKVKVSVSRVNLSELIGNRVNLKRTLNGNKVDKYIYNGGFSINVKCLEVIDKFEHVEVYALKSGSREHVGRLVIFPNKIIKKAEIVLVDVIWGSIREFKKPKDFEFHLKNTTFNQALIRAEIVASIKFKLDDPKIIKNSDVINFLKNCGKMNSNEIRDNIIRLYDKYGNKKPIVNGKVLNLDQDGHARTFVFFSGLNASNHLGVASASNKSPLEKIECFIKGEHNVAHNWGNSVMMYESAINKPNTDKKYGNNIYLYTLIHELAHSFGLPHTFSSASGFNRLSKHKFVEGHIDNVMDYYHIGIKWTNKNLFDKGRFTFFKWQWEIMRNDRSVK